MKYQEETFMKGSWHDPLITGRKENILNWLAFLILFVFAGIIIVPSIASPGYFMGVAAPVLIVMVLFYTVLWAVLRLWKSMKEDETKKGINK